MRFTIIGIVLATLSVFVGCLLPFVSIGPAVKEPINIIWGFIYGWGWYAAGLLGDPRNPWAQFFGGKIWPLVVVGAIVYAASLLRNVQNPVRTMAVVFFLISLVIVFPRRLIVGSPLDSIPTYSKILSAVY